MPLAEGELDGVLNGTTAVTIVAGPPNTNQRRIIRAISIFNADTATVTLTVRLNNDGSIRRIWSGTVATLVQWSLKTNAGLDVLVLTASTMKVEALLSGAPVANQPEFVSAFADATGIQFV